LERVCFLEFQKRDSWVCELLFVHTGLAAHSHDGYKESCYGSEGRSKHYGSRRLCWHHGCCQMLVNCLKRDGRVHTACRIGRLLCRRALRGCTWGLRESEGHVRSEVRRKGCRETAAKKQGAHRALPDPQNLASMFSADLSQGSRHLGALSEHCPVFFDGALAYRRWTARVV
jgi:hypothetical protein